MRSPEKLRKPWKLTLLAAFYVAFGLHTILVVGLALVVYDSCPGEGGRIAAVAMVSVFDGTHCGYAPGVYCLRHGRLRPCRMCRTILGHRLDQSVERAQFVPNNEHCRPDNLIPNRPPALDSDDYFSVTADLELKPSFRTTSE